MIAAALYLANVGWEDHMDGWGPGGWILMGLMMILFWGLVVAGIFWLVRSLGWGGQRRESSALELLDQRLARGEVSVEEYEERRRALQNGADNRP